MELPGAAGGRPSGDRYKYLWQVFIQSWFYLAGGNKILDFLNTHFPLASRYLRKMASLGLSTLSPYLVKKWQNSVAVS